MTAAANPPRPWLRLWLVGWSTLVFAFVVLALAAGEEPVWVNPTAAFVLVCAGAPLCLAASVTMLITAHRRGLAEIGFAGAFALAISVLWLLHGLTMPTVIAGTRSNSATALLIAPLVGSIATVSLYAPRAAWSRALAHRWRAMVITHLVAMVAVSLVVLVGPTTSPVYRSPLVLGCALLPVAGCFVMSLRHLRLAWVGHSARSLLVSLGFALIGGASLQWLGEAPYTAGFWLAEVCTMVGVLLMTVAALATYKHEGSLHLVLQPLVANDPLSALALGLDPLVHQFVASLNDKDAESRDHTIRTATLAMRVGQHLRLNARQLHDLGLGALLHDIGKVSIPDDILHKRGALHPAEFAIVKEHAAAGSRLVASSPVLAAIGPIIRGHHERVDGTGYPDGLRGDAIPLAARIISVCDAYDAMAQNKEYRAGMNRAETLGILRGYAGAQWDAEVVEALIAVTAVAEPETSTPLETVGRMPVVSAR